MEYNGDGAISPFIFVILSRQHLYTYNNQVTGFCAWMDAYDTFEYFTNINDGYEFSRSVVGELYDKPLQNMGAGPGCVTLLLPMSDVPVKSMRGCL